MAVAVRLTDPLRTSPTANTPGRLVFQEQRRPVGVVELGLRDVAAGEQRGPQAVGADQDQQRAVGSGFEAGLGGTHQAIVPVPAVVRECPYGRAVTASGQATSVGRS